MTLLCIFIGWSAAKGAFDRRDCSALRPAHNASLSSLLAISATPVATIVNIDSHHRRSEDARRRRIRRCRAARVGTRFTNAAVAVGQGPAVAAARRQLEWRRAAGRRGLLGCARRQLRQCCVRACQVSQGA